MGIAPKSPKDMFPQVVPGVLRGSLGCCGASTKPCTFVFAIPFLVAGRRRQQPPPPHLHCSPLSPTHMHALPTPTTTLMWSFECSSSALSALKVTGNKAPATTKDQALLPLWPHRHPPLLSPRPPRQPKWQGPGSSLFASPSNLPLSSSSLIYFNLLCFPPWLFSISRRRGEERKEGRGKKGRGMLSWWRARETPVLHGWVVDKGFWASGATKWRGGNGNRMAVQELQGRVDVSQQLVVRFKNVNSDTRSAWGSQENRPFFLGWFWV